MTKKPTCEELANNLVRLRWMTLHPEIDIENSVYTVFIDNAIKQYFGDDPYKDAPPIPGFVVKAKTNAK